jgi:hypothetical protein
MVALLRQAGAAVALGLALACGGSDGPTTPPTTTPPTTLPAPSVILQGSQSIEAFYLWAWDFTTSRAGTIDITIDYTYTSNVILVWVARGTCTWEQFDAEQCTYAATSFTGGKPRKVSVTGAAAGAYTLLVGNVGPDDDSIAFQVVLTPATSASGVGASIRKGSGGFLVPYLRP